MKDNIENLKKEMERIKKMSWIPCDYRNFGAAGIKLEKLLNRNPDNFEIPDYDGIEIKTKKSTIRDDITLFCATPDSYLFEIKRIYELYAYPDINNKQEKVLNCKIYCGKLTYIYNDKLFSIKVDRKKEVIKLLVYDRSLNVIDSMTSWSFDMIKEKLERKLSYLCLVKMDKSFWQNQLYIRYTKDTYYKLRDFDTFIDLVENGTICILFRIGVFKTGKRKGQMHDHGTGFCINMNQLELLFEKLQV